MEPAYRLLSDGTLEIAARGTWRLVAGCSCRGIFEYQDRMGELLELVQGADADDSVEVLYQNDRRFRFLCDRALTLNGLDPDWIRPADLSWLLFGWVDEAGKPQRSPLAVLNDPPQPRHPRAGAAEDGPTDFVRLLAALVSLPDTSPTEALELATALPMREALGLLDERAWAALPEDERDKLKHRQQADKFREKLGVG